MKTFSCPSRTVRGLVSALLLLVAGGCRAVPGEAPVGGAFDVVPDRSSAGEGRLRRVRDLARAQDRGAALALLEADRPLDPHDPERAWLLVALWKDLGARFRAARAVEAMPPGSLRTTLLAATAETPREGLTWLGTGRGPDGFAELVRAHLYAAAGDTAAAQAAAERARSAGPLLVRIDAALLGAALAADRADPASARRLLAEVDAIAPWDARGKHALGLLERAVGRLPEAVAALTEALRLAPRSDLIAHDLHDAWRRLPPGASRDRSGRDVLTLDGYGNPVWHALAGAVFLDVVGDPVAAERHLRSALDGGIGPVPAEHDLRRALARLGRYADAVEILDAAAPPGVRDAPENLVAPCWCALAVAAARAPDRSAPAAARVDLAMALASLGAHHDALEVLGGLDDDRAASLRRRIEADIAFEDALEAQIADGYAAASRGEPARDLDAILAAIPGLAARHLPPSAATRLRDVRAGVSTVPLIGSWVDHSVRTTNPLVRYLRERGRYLVLGQRVGEPVEAVLFSAIYLAENADVRTTGFRHRHDVAIGIDRAIGTAAVAKGAELGGACLPDGLWLDADSARTTEWGWRRALVRDPATLAHADDPPPEVGGEGRLALTDPAGVTERLLRRVMRDRPNDAWSSWWTLRAHEAGHVTDLRRHLPILAGLSSTLRLAVRAGFAPRDVERHLERQAQLAAVIDARDPALAVAEMTAMLPVVERDPEVHRGGYRDALGAMLRHLDRRAGAWPAIDRSRRLLPQLDRLDDGALRQIAWDAWCEGG